MLPDAEEPFIDQELKKTRNVKLNRRIFLNRNCNGIDCFDSRFTETVAQLPVSANVARRSTRIRTVTCHLH